MSVCLSRQTSNRFFFVFRWNQAIFWSSVLHDPSTKRSYIFDLGPITPKIYSPNLHKIAYKTAYMADRPEMFGPTRGFLGMADSMEPYKMLG